MIKNFPLIFHNFDACSLSGQLMKIDPSATNRQPAGTLWMVYAPTFSFCVDPLGRLDDDALRRAAGGGVQGNLESRTSWLHGFLLASIPVKVHLV